MDILELREYCLSLPDTEETTPFDETTLVYKVAGKMFVLTNMIHSESISLKCDPEQALSLRDQYPEIDAAFHMNKKHWNSVRTDGDLPAMFIRQMIRESYLLVVNGLPRQRREEITRLFIESDDLLVK